VSKTKYVNKLMRNDIIATRHTMKMTQQFNNPLEIMVSEKQVTIIAQSLLKLASNSAVQAELPDIDQYVKNFMAEREKGDPTSQEYALLCFYARLHITGSAYSPSEMKLFKKRNAYSCHPGGLSPLILAERFIKPDSVVADLGAGNGLQGLLLQCLYPHRKTLQIELSSELIRVGRIFQKVLGISDGCIEWVHDDIVNVSLEAVDFIYLYRPVRPLEGGKEVYHAIANKLALISKPLVIFSVADCLAEFIDERFSIFYSDGQLTCFVKGKKNL
jgi:16S rRNA G1207 methylase RsmC